jgi:hypothetical protein
MFNLGLELSEEGSRYFTEKEMQNIYTYVTHHKAISMVTGLETLEPAKSLSKTYK